MKKALKVSAQTVFGEGSDHPSLMIVGEIPGDIEDQEGRPFVGPAGKLLRRLLEEIGVDPDRVYLTNAVKNFRYVQRGKRRIHQKPNMTDVRACQPLLIKEITTLNPPVVLALGATAAISICGQAVGIEKNRKKILSTPFSPAAVLVTWHPSGILRSPTDEVRRLKLKQLKDDLKRAWDLSRQRYSTPLE
jgi:uracil-DNA glycosylase